MQGRVSSLIELGAGFHPDMSGRENIYTNAAIFGLNKKEIDSRIQSIIDFSELKDFIDNPVRTYSSGMYMRLAFSVAINVDADILLIDEILAVGDANFQSKCFNKLREIKSHGTTIVIVSHSLGQIEQICDRSIWIHEGLIKAEGPPKEIDLEYLDYMSRKIQDRNKKSEEAADTEEPAENKDGKRWGSGEARIKRIRSFASDGTEQSVFRVGEDIRLTVDYTVKKPVQDAVIGFGIFDMNGVQCYGTNTRIDKLPEMTLTKDGTAEITMKNVQLLSGEYMIDIAIEQGEGIPVDYYRQAYKIQMLSAYGDAGIARVDHTWNLQR